MSRKNHSLRNQANYAISKVVKFGSSKKADRLNDDCNHESMLYGIHRTEDLRDTSNALARHLNENFPEIQKWHDVRPEHVQDFLNTRALREGRGWSKRTCEEMISRMCKLYEIFREGLSIRNEFSEGLEVVYKHEKPVRNKAMKPEHLELIRASFRDRGSRSAGWTAVEITMRTGVRIDEDACLRPEEINIENAVLHISGEGAKNGKARSVPIQPEHMDFFRKLREDTWGKDYCLGGVKAGSLNKSIREEMKRITVEHNGVQQTLSDIYPNSTNHAIRKLWARQRYFGLLKEEGIQSEHPRECPKCRKIWGIVQKELGHEKSLRKDLFTTYIGSPIENYD